MPGRAGFLSLCLPSVLAPAAILAGQDQECVRPAETTKYAVVAAPVVSILRSTPTGAVRQVGRLSHGDVVRVIGRRGPNVLARAPITDSQDSYLIASAHLCAAPDSLSLDPRLYPLQASNLDEQMVNLMQLDNVPPEDISQTTVQESSTRDRAGNALPVTFKVVKWYTKKGRPLSNAIGWYDYVAVKYEAFETGAFEPTDLGEGPTLELRQGYDSASRSVLLLADPDGSGTPIALYAGSNSDNRTIFAIVPNAGGQWLAYRCTRQGVSAIGQSQRSYQGVRPQLLLLARRACAPTR